MTLVSNRSFGFTAGELGTVNRVGSNNNLILFNNCFGLIKAELQLRHHNEYVDFATNFNPVDYLNLAKGCARGSETGIIQRKIRCMRMYRLICT
jgi:thiamine pyrophosphate-dependent acetolactate synthase large subunit-like protein